VSLVEASGEWSHTVTFNANYTDGPAPQTRIVTNPATSVGTLPQAPTRSNYSFKAWNTKANGSGDEFTGTTPVTANITVYAQWQAVVNAGAPAISVQPRGATYFMKAAAAALSIQAASPDGGTLSYQWHSAVTGGTWTAIAGATGASYTPSTDRHGSVSYYVRVTNTNNNVTGSKTAGASSSPAIVVVNVGAPVISGQPQNASYHINGTAAALSVTAESPDGGTLSYQWHSAAAGGTWTAIAGASGASYTPPTSQTGSISYYAQITNTNSNGSGTPTAQANSSRATITVSRSGGGLVIVPLVDEDNLINNVEGILDPSRSSGESFSLEAKDDLTALQWSVNNVPIPAPRGTAKSIVINAVDYPTGHYTLSLYAERDEVPYSLNITFIVEN
jgi:uncharacterized repeat protein (TIGR02543 family)